MSILRSPAPGWELPPLLPFTPTDLSTFRCALTLVDADGGQRTASWAVSESAEAAASGTVSVTVEILGSSWIGVFAWDAGLPPALLSRAIWCVEEWLARLRVEGLFLPDRLPSAAEVAVDRGLAPASVDGYGRGYFATRLRTGRGFVFVSDAEPRGAHDDVLRRDPHSPGWLVVESEITRVGTSGWPGRLYGVEISAPSSMEQRIAQLDANAGFRFGITHTRVAAARIVAEIPLAGLFGHHGDGVLRVLRLAEHLSPEDARLLADLRSLEADRLYGAAWSRWKESPAATDARGVLLAPGHCGSPIGNGFMLISSLMEGRVSDRVLDEDGDAVLPEPWPTARLALLDAAMALGAPHLLSQEEREVLLRPFLGAED